MNWLLSRWPRCRPRMGFPLCFGRPDVQGRCLLHYMRDYLNQK